MLSLICGLSAFGEAAIRQPLQRPGSCCTVRLDKNRPSVYITLEREGERAPLRNTESSQGVWLRLHNNTAWVITLDGFEVPNRGYGDIGVFDEIVSNVTDDGLEIIRGGYGPPHVSSTVKLKAGKSILFSLPKEHLSENYAIRFEFSYGWEDEDDVYAGREAKHYVYFFSSQLPSVSTPSANK